MHSHKKTQAWSSSLAADTEWKSVGMGAETPKASSTKHEYCPGKSFPFYYKILAACSIM
jgi:hypothetical protein